MQLNQETIDLLDAAFRKVHASYDLGIGAEDRSVRKEAIAHRQGVLLATASMTGGSLSDLYDQFYERLARDLFKD